jgi:chaperonin GroES
VLIISDRSALAYIVTSKAEIKMFNLKNSNKMSEVKIRPLGTRVVIEAVEAEQKTASGIIIPDSAKEKPQQGKVVAVGKGTEDEPMEVKVGDTVMYGKYSGTELQYEGNDYLIMSQSDILAIV